MKYNEMNSKYGFGKSVDMSFADAVARVTQALQEDDAGHLLEMPFDWQTNPHFMDVALTERRLSCVREYRF